MKPQHDRRDRRGDEEQPPEREREQEQQQKTNARKQAHAHAVRANSEPERPEQEQRERADSTGVFGLIKRLLPRRQPRPEPYRFRNFPQNGS
jgi:hypothetical protein